MYVIGTFEYDTSLELALKDIENKGIERKDILCIPLEKRVTSNKFFDTLHRTDGKNTMAIPFFSGTALSLFGSVYGFLWAWGPIIWGGLGFLIGAALGFLILYFIHRKQKFKTRRDSRTEVVVMIRCEKEIEEEIARILWEQYALGVAKLYR